MANSEVYDVDTRQHLKLHQPLSNLTKCQTGVYYLGIKVFSMLPSYMKQESNRPKRFKLILKKFLNINSFYSIEEYFQLHNIRNYMYLV
jgi:hypothetical protein